MLRFLLLLSVLGSTSAFALRQIECQPEVLSGDTNSSFMSLRFMVALPDTECAAALGFSVSLGDTRLSDLFFAEWENGAIQIELMNSPQSNFRFTLHAPYSKEPTLSVHSTEYLKTGLNAPPFKCVARTMP